MAKKDKKEPKKPGPEAQPIVVPLPFSEAVQAALNTASPPPRTATKRVTKQERR